MRVSAAARRADPTLPATWRARALRYQRPGFPPQVLLTSLLDAAARSRRRAHSPVPRALGDGTRLRRDEDRGAGARGGDPQPESGGRPRRSSGGCCSPTTSCGWRWGASPTPRAWAPTRVSFIGALRLHSRRVALVRGRGPGGDPAPPHRLARGPNAADPPGATAGAALPARRRSCG
jgi:hypothetical protein